MRKAKDTMTRRRHARYGKRNNEYGLTGLGDEATIDAGILHRPTSCPKCEAPMRQEPGLSICCNGHTFYLRGTDYRLQQRWEESSGLVTALAHAGSRVNGKWAPSPRSR